MTVNSTSISKDTEWNFLRALDCLQKNAPLRMRTPRQSCFSFPVGHIQIFTVAIPKCAAFIMDNTDKEYAVGQRERNCTWLPVKSGDMRAAEGSFSTFAHARLFKGMKTS